MPKDGDFRVWWIPQIPGKPFLAPVGSVAEGRRLCQILANYDLWQYEQRVKPDYSNVGGVHVYRDGEWEDVDDDEDA